MSKIISQREARRLRSRVKELELALRECERGHFENVQVTTIEKLEFNERVEAQLHVIRKLGLTIQLKYMFEQNQGRSVFALEAVRRVR